jgi:hypothetical protein
MSPESVHSLLALAFGFAVAGLLASVYQLRTERPPSFALLRPPMRKTYLVLPFLMFTAPFIIMRNAIGGAGAEEGSFGFAMLATMVAGFWSLMSGTVVIQLITVVNLFVA